MKRIVLLFASEAQAIADPVLSQYYTPPDLPESDPDYRPGAWRADMICTTNDGLVVGKSGNPLPGFWLLISRPDSDTACCGHALCQVAWDNDTGELLGGACTCADVSQMWLSPVPMGAFKPFPQANYPAN